MTTKRYGAVGGVAGVDNDEYDEQVPHNKVYTYAPGAVENFSRGALTASTAATTFDNALNGS